MASAAVALIAAVVVAGPTVAWAAPPPPFVVNDPVDAPDAVIDGVCATAGTGLCTLRAAVQEANGRGGSTDITFASAADVSTLSVAGAGGADAGDLDINPGVTIRMFGNQVTPTTTTTIRADGLGDRHVQVQAGARLELQLVTLSGGSTTGDGGAILNEGQVLITNNPTSTGSYVALSANHADGSGGAVTNTVGAQFSVQDVSTASSGSRIDLTANTATGNGGAVSNNGGFVTFGGGGGVGGGASHDVYVDSNRAADGGGVYNAGAGTVTLACRSFVRFSQAGRGGDVFNADGRFVMTGGGLDGGRATSGGGLYNDGAGTVTVTENPACPTDQAITRSVSVDDGGGVLNRGRIDVQANSQFSIRGDDAGSADDARSGAGLMVQAGTVEIRGDLSVDGTQAGVDGGGIAVTGGDLRTVGDGRIRVANSRAGQRGGGISVSGGNASLVNGAVLFNAAPTGAGISVVAGSIDFRNTTIARNVATSVGGGLSGTGGSSLLRYVTMADNSPDGLSSGGGGTALQLQRVLMARNGTGDCVGAAVRVGDFNVFDDTTCNPIGTDLTDPSRFADVAGRLDADIATDDADSYGLQAGQPAIDFVTDACADPDVDQLGNGRPTNGDGANGPQCDAGSIEASYGGPARSISGLVRDELTGLPMAGVCVYLGLIRGNNDGTAALTGPDGRYRSDVPEGEFVVAFFRPVGGAATPSDCNGERIDRSLQPEWYRNVAVQFLPPPDENQPVMPDLNQLTRVVVGAADVSGIDACLGTGPGPGRDTPCLSLASTPLQAPTTTAPPNDAGSITSSTLPATWRPTGSPVPRPAATPAPAVTALPRTGGDLTALPVGLVLVGLGLVMVAFTRSRRRIS